MPCLPNPKVNPPAAQPAPAAKGADALMLGGGSNDEVPNRTRGAVGRLALRVPRKIAGE